MVKLDRSDGSARSRLSKERVRDAALASRTTVVWPA